MSSCSFSCKEGTETGASGEGRSGLHEAAAALSNSIDEARPEPEMTSNDDAPRPTKKPRRGVVLVGDKAQLRQERSSVVIASLAESYTTKPPTAVHNNNTDGVLLSKLSSAPPPPPLFSPQNEFFVEIAPRPSKDYYNMFSPHQVAKKKSRRRHAEPGTSSSLRRPSFPEKLMLLLRSNEAQHAMCWMPDGESFAMDPKIFSETILSRYFDLTKFESFTRKLNRWGFRRVLEEERSDGINIYRHRLFKRDFPELCQGMSGGKSKESHLTHLEMPLHGREELSHAVARQNKLQAQGLASVQERTKARDSMGTIHGLSMMDLPNSTTSGMARPNTSPDVNHLMLLRRDQNLTASSSHLDWIYQQQLAAFMQARGAEECHRFKRRLPQTQGERLVAPHGKGGGHHFMGNSVPSGLAASSRHHFGKHRLASALLHSSAPETERLHCPELRSTRQHGSDEIERRSFLQSRQAAVENFRGTLPQGVTERRAVGLTLPNRFLHDHRSLLSRFHPNPRLPATTIQSRAARLPPVSEANNERSQLPGEPVEGSATSGRSKR